MLTGQDSESGGACSDENPDGRSMHSGWKPIYYIFKMFLSILVTLLRK
jgi:hypothetical protein